jgi:hypothetical protein
MCAHLTGGVDPGGLKCYFDRSTRRWIGNCVKCLQHSAQGVWSSTRRQIRDGANGRFSEGPGCNSVGQGAARPAKH